MMRYGSVCSGIEAATVAWHPLGWRAQFFSEIEPFPSAVLAHHYPDVPNLGDMTKFKEWPDADIDVLVGGTPCQSFSVAGLRKGLADPRGNLALVYLAIADRYRPEWLVWENVPGVLSSNGGRDFGAFLGGMAELGYGFAYRVLDAQYVRVDGFGRAVPQRRRRVFVIGNSRSWTRAAAVLFEPESLSWNSAPRREAGERTSHAVAQCLVSSGRGVERTGDTRGQDNVVAVASTGDVSHCLNAGGMGRIDYETETMIAHALRDEGFDASEDGSGRGTPIVPVVAKTLTRGAESAGKGGYAGRRQVDDDNLVATPFNITPSNSNKDYNAREASYAQAVTTQGGAPSARGGDIIASGWAVRRLMPEECEALQGFKRGYTAIIYRGKPAADGPRYKSLGNSFAVNVVKWIGHRIDLVQSLTTHRKASAA